MAIAYVNGNNASASGTTIVFPATGATSGNCIVVAVAANDATAANRTVSSISDTAGNSYAILGSSYTNGNNRLEIWAAFNITGNASNIVTVTFGGTPTDAFGCFAQLSGVATSSAHDTGYAPAGNSDASTPYTTTDATTASDNEWVIGCFFSTGEDNTFAGSSPTVLRQSSLNTQALTTRPTTTAGSYSTAVTFGVGTTMLCLARAIKEYVAPTSIRRVFLFY
jgi:hypothetical protein